MQPIWSFVTDFGDTAVTVPLAALMGCFLVGARQPRLAAGWALAIVGCAGAIGGLKLVLAACGYSLGVPGQASPSGHTAMSVAVYGGYAAVIGASLARPARALLIAGAAMLMVGIAVSRVTLGAHSPLEVWIALAIGVAALGLFAAIVVRYHREKLPIRWLVLTHTGSMFAYRVLPIGQPVALSTMAKGTDTPRLRSSSAVST